MHRATPNPWWINHADLIFVQKSQLCCLLHPRERDNGKGGGRGIRDKEAKQGYGRGMSGRGETVGQGLREREGGKGREGREIMKEVEGKEVRKV